MRRNRTIAVLCLFLARFALAGDGCGPAANLDAGLDIWCGDTLCAWTVEEGAIERVPTWQRSDFGVSLVGPAVTLAQRFRAPEPCYAVDLLVDRGDDVDLRVDLDFYDDARVDLSFPVTASDWESERLLFAPPADAGTLALLVRKSGEGRAVLARVRVETADAEETCPAAPEVLDRPLGVRCERDDHCASGRCVAVRQSFVDEEHPTVGACSACEADADCAEGEVCGVEPGDWLHYLGCGAAGRHVLGERCVAAAECATGVCTGDFCSTCGDAPESGCAAGEACGLPELTPFGGPSLCAPDGGRRAAGEPCLGDGDCASGACRGEGELTLCWDGRRCERAAECREGECGAVGVVDGRCE